MMKLIKVKQFATIPPPFGGVSVYVSRLVSYYRNLGHDVGSFYTDTSNGLSSKKMSHMHKFPSHTRSIWGLYAFPRLFMIFRKYDLIHTHLSLNTSFLVWLLHKTLHLPIVYSIHNQMIDREYEKMNKLDRYFFNELRKDAKVQFITVNTKTRTLLVNRFGNFARPIKVQPAFIPPVEIGQETDYLSSDLLSFINTSSPLMLFYAESYCLYNGAEIYGSSTMMQMFIRLKKQIPSLRLVFCMPNPDYDVLKRYKEELTLSKYENDVYFQVSPLKEMWPLLKHTNVLFRPTCTDGDAIMIREALTYGVAVLASDVTDRPQGCQVYPYNSNDQAFCQLMNMLSNDNRIKNTSCNYAEELLSIYNNVLN